MSLRTTLGRLSSESSLEEGTPDEVAEKRRRAHDEVLRPARLEAARRNSRWHEIDDDLVPRARGWLVSARTDLIYKPVRGVVFESYSTTAIADQAELSFTVDDQGDLQFYERIAGSWSEHVARKARRDAARR